MKLPRRFGLRRTHPHGMLADGRVLVSVTSSVFDISAGAVTSFPLMRVERNGLVFDTIVSLPLVPEDYWIAEDSPGPMPIQKSPLFALGPDGSSLAVVERWPWIQGMPRTYRVIVRDLIRQESRVFEIPYVPALVNKERLIEVHLSQASPATVEAVRKGLDSFRHFPPVSDLEWLGAEELWVRREETSGDSVRWDAISTAAGDLIGSLVVPRELRLLALGDAEVWVEIRDEFDVPFLKKYTLIGGIP